MNDSVGREPLKEGVERGGPDVVEGAEHRDTKKRTSVEHENVACPKRVPVEVAQRTRPAPDYDDRIVGDGLEAK
jgi:hypothetical protein